MDVLHGKVDTKATIGVSLKEIHDHMKMEEKALDFAKEAVEKINNKAVKLLLQHIIEDEEKHHEILERLAKNFIKATSKSTS
jgi:rubrerythrin